MARIWTPAQKTAIESRGVDLLVSAAAGSGKTATLTERIIRSLTDKDSPADISKMLIVTFTRASAADLRQKIFSALSDALAENPADKHLAEQLVKLNDAKISTIDSFYLDLIRENFSTLGLSPSFRIADTAEMVLLSKELMNDTIDELYNKDADSFSRFVECFVNIRGASRLTDVMLDLHSHISSYPEGIEYLKNSADKCMMGTEGDFFESSFGSITLSDVKDKISYYAIVLSDAVNTIITDEKVSRAYLASFSYDLTFCRDMLEILDQKNYSSARSHILGYSPIKLGSLPSEFATDEIVAFKEKRTQITKDIRSIAKNSFGLTAENIVSALKDTQEMTLKLYETLSLFEKKLNAEKLRRAVFDFNDIRRYALKLLVNADGTPTEYARTLSLEFTDIYIDEYQDVDRVQDMIFRAISNGSNRFMVGDIKQSIYGFRGAEPGVFAHYRATFPAISDESSDNCSGRSIFMSNNFRCDENIIAFTNRVCSYLFGICSENIGYTSDDDLVFSKIIEDTSYVSPKVKLSVIIPPLNDSDAPSSADTNRYNEAKYIAAEVSKLLKDGSLQNGSKIKPANICVLFRSKNMLPHLRRAFDEFGIEYCGGDDDEYFEDPSVLLVLSVLNVIDNPHRDIYLAGALNSPLFNCSMDELIVLRKYRDSSYSLFEAIEAYAADETGELADKLRDFLSILSDWRDTSISLSVDKLIRRIYSSRVFCTSLTVTDNLRALYEYARKFESGGFKGLYNFIEYVNRIIDEGTKIDTGADSSSDDCVSFMTIHHSKGLEYPVCFLCGTAGEFSKSDFKESLLFHADTGAAMKLSAGEGFARINTPMRAAVASKIVSEQTEEEMRVLYVALTRAREYLYVTASTSKSPEKLLAAAKDRKMYSSRYTLMKCHSPLEWILTAIADRDMSDICDVSFISSDILSTPFELFNIKPLDEKDVIADSELERILAEKFSFEYPYAKLSRIPAKISVSKLSPDILDEKDTSQELFAVKEKNTVPPILLGQDTGKRSAAERGTATHLFLQFCDMQRTEATGVKAEMAYLIEKGFLPKDIEDIAFTNEIEAFFESELYGKIKRAQRVIREQRFNILLPASDFSNDPELSSAISGELMAVQGVIDLILIDEDGALCLYDYKTDRLSLSELSRDDLLSKKMSSLHSQQLSYYKLAVEAMLGRRCDIVQIYSTHAAKTVDV